jgi:Na+/melibiose symporter-like transporter
MPQNFSAAYAIVFCAGLYLPGVAGWIIPLALLAGTDLVISLVFYPQFFSWTHFLIDQSPNYIAYAGLIAMGRSLGRKRPWWLLLGGGIVGAMLFYLVTNTAAWLILPYAKTLAGWIQAMTTGLPGHVQTWEFFRNTLSSGGLFTGLFVGAMKMTEAKEEEEDKAEEKEEDAQPADEEPAPADAEN